MDNNLMYALILFGLVGLYFVLSNYLPYLTGSGRLTGLLKNLDVYKGLMQVSPVPCFGDESSYKLCDYYIATSARPVFAGTKIVDWISQDAIKKIISAGARFMELDVNEEQERPVVSFVNKDNFRQTMNVVYLEDALKTIADNAWNTTIAPNSSDPFILSLNINGENTTLINNTAAVLKEELQTRMLGLEYAYQRKNLAQEAICNLKEKIVIISGGNHKNTDMDELVNLSWSGPNLRRMTLTQVEEVHDHEELTDFNKQNITLVIPDAGTTENKNKGFDVAWTFGCQAVMAFYQSQDKDMENYVSKFQTSSFVLKPAQLRYSKPTYPTPVPQIEQKKSTPIQVKTAMYTATI